MAYAVTSDTQKIDKTLESKGFNSEQVEGLNAWLNERMEQNNVVTFRLVASREDVEKIRLDVEKVRTEMEKWRASNHEDVANLRASTNGDFASLRASTQEEFGKIRLEMEKMRGDFKEISLNTKVELIKWMLGAIVATGGLCAAIASLFVAYFR